MTEYETIISEITSLLEKAQVDFLRFEEATNALVTCPFEQIEPNMKKRVSLSGKIDRIYERVYELCDQAPNPKQLRDTVSNRANYADLDSAAQMVFEHAQKIFATVRRTLEMDEQVNARLNAEKDFILMKIRENNLGVEAKAAKFYGGTHAQGKKRYFPDKKTTI